MKTDNLSRKEREKSRQRQEMIDTAMLLFSEKGYHNVSVQEIAEKAEFAIGTIYKFFPTKADLYKTIVLQKFEAFDEAFEQAIHGTDDEVEKLRRYIQTKAESVRSNLAFVRLFVAESRGISFNIETGLVGMVQDRYYNFLKRLALIIESGIKSKRFKKIAPSFTLAAALDSVVNTFLLLWLEAPETHPFPENPDEILDIFFKGLLNG